MDVPDDTEIVYTSVSTPGHHVLETLLDEGVPITQLVSISPEMGHAAGVAKYTDFSEIAEANDLPIYYPETYSMGEADVDFFEELDADLMIVNGWNRIIPGEVLDTFPRGVLGNHGSAFGLPKGRGRSPLNWSLIEDLDRFLLSLIRLDADVDAGAVAATRKFDITEFDTIQSLYYKVSLAIEAMLLDVIPPICRGDHTFEPQDGEPTYYPKRTPEDGEINWGEPMAAIYNLVRAVTQPYPGAFTFHDGERVDVWSVRPFSTDFGFEADPGEILAAFHTDEFVVSTPDGSVLVTDWAADGWRPEAGMVFESAGDHDRVDGIEQKQHLTASDDD
ncbi:MAG: formyltransferase family protein [Halohasta sp.]